MYEQFWMAQEYFLMVNNNYNQLVKYSININYEYGKFLHFTSIINIYKIVPA